MQQKIYIESITQPAPTIRSDTSLEKVIMHFSRNKQFSLVPIVDNNIVQGVLMRNIVLEMFARPYMRELFGRRPVAEYLDRNSLIVPHDSQIEDVSKLLTADLNQELPQEFVVTRNNEFFGIAKTHTLLRRITDQRILDAQHANPLTGLPGYIAINEEIRTKLENAESFYIAYFDLDNFKPYNDYYGFARGDDVIEQIGQLLQDRISDPHFLGHVGGDDFVGIFIDDSAIPISRKITKEFDQLRSRFYDQEDLAQGHIMVRGRHGEERPFELISISVGIVHPDIKACESYLQVSRLCSDAKKQAKAKTGSSVFISRRRKPDTPTTQED